MSADLREAVAPLRRDPGRSVLLFDFDGTLSAVVDDPAAAVALPGVAERLERLAASYRLVGAVSGRPVAFLAGVLPPTLVLSGLYGLESRVDGRVVDHPEADRWRPVVAQAVAAVTAATAPGEPGHGIVVEAKGLSITLHVRTRPELGEAVVELAHQVAAPTGLVVRPAKMSVELHPPVEADKGTALRALAEGAGAVLYAGDDVGDLPAFAALDDLAQRAPFVATLGVVVDGPELPDELRAPHRLVLPDQAAVLALLDALAV
ncbi:trehalose-phosphatase [Aquihabitans daechungensis]|uniref:trehalose-phosphatase n=1 Tax=Aquihabitans daechungensis TaxID=1052257 RepID=UPI003B9E01FF